MPDKDIEFEVYWMLCRDCPNAKHCHDSCESCEEYEDALEEAYNKKGGK